MQMEIMMADEIRVVKVKGLNYPLGEDGRPVRARPWIGNALSLLYDFAMERSVFPGKFGSDMEEHHRILRQALAGVRGKRVLELAGGSGNAVHFLANDNRYACVDVSPGLLKQAVKRFRSAGFRDAEFYVASADALPFENESFDACLCILGLHFLDDVEKVVQEVFRVLVPQAEWICSVPVPERNLRGTTTRGVPRSEEQLAESVNRNGFRYERIDRENGTLLYFKGIKDGLLAGSGTATPRRSRDVGRRRPRTYSASRST